MGLKYCRPIRIPSSELNPLQVFNQTEVRTKHGIFVKTYNKKGLYFITHEELKEFFGFSNIQIFHCMDVFSVHRDVRRVNSLDFWCAIALAASGSSEEKISFCFKLIDGNNDNHISYHELIVLLLCATRGIANLKGLTLVPEDVIDFHAIKMFTQYQKTLNSGGDIALPDITEYLLTNDQCRTYLVALGAKIPPIDAAAIVLKRANILRELALVRFQAEEVLNEIAERQESGELFEHREGDMELLRLDRQDFPALPIALTTTIPTLQMKIQQREEGDELKGKEMRTGLDRRHPVNQFFQFDDSWMAEIYQNTRFQQQQQQLQQRKLLQIAPTDKSRLNTRGSESTISLSASRAITPATTTDPHINTLTTMNATQQQHPSLLVQNIYGRGFENALLKEWKKIPQLVDKMIHLDAFTLMAIFEEVNVKLTYTQAKDCLASVRKSQLLQVYFDDVLHWFRLHYADIGYAQEQVQRRLTILEENNDTHNIFDSEDHSNVKEMQKHSNEERFSIAKELRIHHDYETWQYLIQQGKTQLNGWYSFVKSAWDRLQLQRCILTDWKENGTSFAKRLTEFRQNSNKKLSSILISYDVNHRKLAFQTHAKQYPLQINTTGVFSHPMTYNPLATNGQNKPKTPTGNANSPQRGRTPTAAKDKNNTTKDQIKPEESVKYNTNLRLFCRTNPHTNLSTKRPKDMSRMKLKVKEEFEEPPPQERKTDEATSDQTANTAKNETSEENPKEKESEAVEKPKSGYEIVHIQDHENLQASDILDFVNLQCELIHQKEHQQSSSSGSDPSSNAKRHSMMTLPASITSPSSAPPASTSAAGSESTPKATSSKQYADLKGPRVFQSAGWMVFSIKPDAPLAQILLLRQMLEDFFNLVPLELRFQSFSTVYVQICSVDPPVEETKPAEILTLDRVSGKGGKGGKMSLAQAMLQNLQLMQEKEAKEKAKEHWIILVSLLHDEDLFVNIEQSIIMQLSMFFSRTLCNCQMDLSCTETLSSLFSTSLPYTQLDTLLYGPQEEELEEYNLINPLKFMKEMKATKTAYRELISNLSSKSREELVNICVQYGVKSSGTFRDLLTRCEKVLTCKYELCGYYELSRTSKQVIYELLYYLKYSLPKLSQSLIHQTDFGVESGTGDRDSSPPKTPKSPAKSNSNSRRDNNNRDTEEKGEAGVHPSNIGFNFWEFNSFLHAIDLPTLYQKEHFDAFVNEYDMLLTKNSEITVSSIFQFYERFGSLLQERDQWRIGSLDHLFVGKVNFQCYYDSYALSSLLKLYTTNHTGNVINPHSSPATPPPLPTIQTQSADDSVSGSSQTMQSNNTKPSLFTLSNTLVTHAHTVKDKEKSALLQTTPSTTTWVGQHYDMLFNIPPFIRYLLPYMNIKEVSMDKSIHRLSDVFQDLALPWEELGIKSFRQLLSRIMQSPGGWVEWITELQNVWSYGEEGLLPMLRRFIKTGINESPLTHHRRQSMNNKSTTHTATRKQRRKSKQGKRKGNGGGRSGKVISPSRTSSRGSSRSRSPMHRSPSQSFRSHSRSRVNSYDSNEDEFADHDVAFASEDGEDLSDVDGEEFEGENEDDKEGYDILADDDDSVNSHSTHGSHTTSSQQDQDRKSFDKLFQHKFMKEVTKQLQEAMEEEMQKRKEMEELHAAEAQAVAALESVDTPLTGEIPASSSSRPSSAFKSKRQLEYDVICEVIRLFLPAAVQKMKDKNWKAVKEEIISDLVFLNYVKTFNSSFELTYEENIQLENHKQLLNKQLKVVLELEHKNYQQITVHAIMLYDLNKLIGQNIGQIGWGTKDFCLGGNVISGWDDFWDCLPWGKAAAETPPVVSYMKAKYDRFHERKLNALAALEREKLRRNLTEEDRERIRLEKLLKQKELFYAEEIKLYEDVMVRYYEIKEFKELGQYVSRDQQSKLIAAYEDLLKLKESRFPNDIYTQIIRNNLAVILFELYGMDHPSAEPVPFLLKDASDKVMELGYEDQMPTNNTTVPVTPVNSISPMHFPAEEAHLHNGSTVASMSIPSAAISGNSDSSSIVSNLTSDILIPPIFPIATATNKLPFVPSSSSTSIVSEGSQNHSQSPSQSVNQSQFDGKDGSTITTHYPQGVRNILNPANKAMIIVNYIIYLLSVDDFTLLRQTIPLKLLCLECWRLLSLREQEKFLLGVLPDVEGMNVLILQKSMIASTMQNIVKEAEYYVKQQQRGSSQGYFEEHPPGMVFDENDSSPGKTLLSASSVPSLVKDPSVHSATTAVGDEESVATSISQITADPKISKKLSQKQKAEKYAEQRKKDNQLRQQVSKQRKILYDLIQSDQISKIFEAKASQAESPNKPVWGAEKNQALQDKQDEFNLIAAGMATHQIESISKKK